MTVVEDGLDAPLATMTAAPWGELDPAYTIGKDPCFGEGCLYRDGLRVSSTHLVDGFWADAGLSVGCYGSCYDSRPGASTSVGFAATDVAFAVVKGRSIRRDRYLRSFKVAFACTELASREAYELKLDDEQALRELLRKHLLAARSKLDDDLAKLGPVAK